MSLYAVLKTVHIVSSTVLFGAGIGTAFFKWIVDRSGNLAAIAVVAEKVVLADWLFTTPAILVQAITGVALALMLGYPMLKGWLLMAIGLYLLAGACWLPVVWLQMKMRDLARVSRDQVKPLDPQYWVYARIWFWLGVPAFTALVIVFWLMVAKPF
ncbi:MAG: DUF2269 domain-containing protein [Steroidobacteraceae bacterium]